MSTDYTRYVRKEYSTVESAYTDLKELSEAIINTPQYRRYEYKQEPTSGKSTGDPHKDEHRALQAVYLCSAIAFANLTSSERKEITANISTEYRSDLDKLIQSSRTLVNSSLIAATDHVLEQFLHLSVEAEIKMESPQPTIKTEDDWDREIKVERDD